MNANMDGRRQGRGFHGNMEEESSKNLEEKQRKI